MLGVGVAFALTLGGLWLLTPFAQRAGLIDHPVGRKNHREPTPVTGGLAMLGAILVAGILLHHDASRASQGFAVSAVLMTALGVADDKYDLSWRLRIAGQIVVALAMIYIGGIRVERLGDAFGLDLPSLGLLSVPFTVFATVGVINAINMVDGADGLAGLLVLGALIMLDAAALYSGNTGIYTSAPILIGAVAGFLVLNLRLPRQPRARVFMGNAGSAFLGLTIACFSFRLTQNTAHPVSPVLALWLVPVPIVDCLVLMIRRVRNGRSPFAADHNHVHHLMQEAGFGPTQAAVILAVFSCACGLSAAVILRLHVPHPVLMIAFGGLCLLWYWLTSRRVRAVGFFRSLRGIVRKAAFAPPLDGIPMTSESEASAGIDAG